MSRLIAQSLNFGGDRLDKRKNFYIIVFVLKLVDLVN